MKNFKALGLSSKVIEALDTMGFETPTEIQEQTIPLLLSNPVDFIGLAQTGTGKTAAFGLPLIELIDVNERHTQALVLAPTRELAQQISLQLQDFSRHLKDLGVTCVFGGANIQNQIRELRRGPQIIVATPGRLIDLMRRGAIKLNRIDYVVLDEADEMLNMGFREELDTILSETPENKITWLFSATMPAEIKSMVKNYMVDPQEVRINTGQKVNINIDHQYAVIKASDKTEALRRIVDFNPNMYAVVFCRTKIDTQKVATDLVESGYTAEALHGDLSQAQRDAVMKRFRAQNLQLLIATDVAARGIDVDNLSHVIHFALPDDPEYYVHRSGRTARAGKKGVSLSLITKGETRKLRYLENKLKLTFSKAMIPAAEEIARNRIEHWAQNLASQEEEMADDKSLETATQILQQFSKEDLIAKLVSRQLNKITRKNSLSDLNDTSKEGKFPKKFEKREGGFEPGMQRFYINLGKMDQLNTGALLRLVCDHSGLTGNDIGRINMDRKHSYIDIKEDAAGKAKALNGMEVEGRSIRINRDDSAPVRSGKQNHRKGKRKKRKN